MDNIQFSNKIGYHPKTIYSILSGDTKRISIRLKNLLMSKFGVREEFIDKGEEPIFIPWMTEVIERINVLQRDPKRNYDNKIKKELSELRIQRDPSVRRNQRTYKELVR